MNRDSRPEEFTAPSLEEVMAYAREHDLADKLNVQKFYTYYSKTDFLFKGQPMDWKMKMQEWAKTEKNTPKNYVTAKEYSGRNDSIYWPTGIKTKDDLMGYLKGAIEKI